MTIHFEPDDYKGLPISMDPERLGGRPVFEGTRVPVDALWGNLAYGMSMDEFLDNFPTVTREQADAVLRFGFRVLAKTG